MRHMTRDELTAELSATKDITHEQVREVLDGLAELGVNVEALVKWTPREPEPKRRRYATRAELARLMLNDRLCVDWPLSYDVGADAYVEASLTALDKLGVVVDALVKIEVDEP